MCRGCRFQHATSEGAGSAPTWCDIVMMIAAIAGVVINVFQLLKG